MKTVLKHCSQGVLAGVYARTRGVKYLTRNIWMELFRKERLLGIMQQRKKTLLDARQ